MENLSKKQWSAVSGITEVVGNCDECQNISDIDIKVFGPNCIYVAVTYYSIDWHYMSRIEHCVSSNIDEAGKWFIFGDDGERVYLDETEIMEMGRIY